MQPCLSDQTNTVKLRLKLGNWSFLNGSVTELTKCLNARVISTVFTLNEFEDYYIFIIHYILIVIVINTIIIVLIVGGIR